MNHKINYRTILETSNGNLAKLHDIVLKALEEEELISEKLKNNQDLSLAEKMADRVASFGGSWRFIITFSIIILIWISTNVLLLKNHGFDPYPFILLNLMLSCIAALQAPIIMMSQNRKEERDRLRAEQDYMINLKAEIEIRTLHDKIDLLITEQMKNLFDIQKVQMDSIDKLRKTLHEHLKPG
ncbi:DUF1003 domain-containing protein [Pedobacter glucosidilyticus]|uniref:DUF1003 domain-containing protein n=1 Tax=Pedobacter glucosidilyticus TaxID=1122941 RepID=UPI00040982A1|nr:DUF1003 domain-containing protein [Pedobacter glucosidilyticus]